MLRPSVGSHSPIQASRERPARCPPPTSPPAKDPGNPIHAELMATDNHAEPIVFDQKGGGDDPPILQRNAAFTVGHGLLRRHSGRVNGDIHRRGIVQMPFQQSLENRAEPVSVSDRS